MKISQGAFVSFLALSSFIFALSGAKYAEAQEQPQQANPLAYPSTPNASSNVTAPAPVRGQSASGETQSATIVDEHGNLKLSAPPPEPAPIAPRVTIPQGTPPADSTALPQSQPNQQQSQGQPGGQQTEEEKPKVYEIPGDKGSILVSPPPKFDTGAPGSVGSTPPQPSQPGASQ